jgi:hypothetical protein
MAADTLSLYGVNTKSNHTIYHYYKKIFLVPVGNLFFMSTTSKDMIYEIQKFKHLWCRLSWTDTKNRIFSVDCYISRHQKLIFNNKKLISPDLGPQGPDPIQPSLGCHWTTMVVVEPSPCSSMGQGGGGAQEGQEAAVRASMPPRPRASTLARLCPRRVVGSVVTQSDGLRLLEKTHNPCDVR